MFIQIYILAPLNLSFCGSNTTHLHLQAAHQSNYCFRPALQMKFWDCGVFESWRWEKGSIKKYWLPKQGKQSYLLGAMSFKFLLLVGWNGYSWLFCQPFVSILQPLSHGTHLTIANFTSINLYDLSTGCL